MWLGLTDVTPSANRLLDQVKVVLNPLDGRPNGLVNLRDPVSAVPDVLLQAVIGVVPNVALL